MKASLSIHTIKANTLLFRLKRKNMHSHSIFLQTIFINLSNMPMIKIQLIGDLPIFIALDSADVWANSSLFDLNSEGFPVISRCTSRLFF